MDEPYRKVGKKKWVEIAPHKGTVKSNSISLSFGNSGAEIYTSCLCLSGDVGYYSSEDPPYSLFLIPQQLLIYR